MRICKKCGESKPLTEYYKVNKNSKFYHGKCKACTIKKGQDNYDPVKRRNENLKRTYGIGLDEYNIMLEKQDGKCAVCGTTEPKGRQSGRGKVECFYVDHNHTTGEVRGLLCNACNRAIGNFQDDPNIIRKAIAYLS